MARFVQAWAIGGPAANLAANSATWSVNSSGATTLCTSPMYKCLIGTHEATGEHHLGRRPKADRTGEGTNRPTCRSRRARWA